MSIRTAPKYPKSGRLPSESKVENIWKTHEHEYALESDQPLINEFLKANYCIEAKPLFKHLQRERSGKYNDYQLRTFQLRVKQCRALEEPAQEIYLPQIYHSGEWGESDLTNINCAGIIINSSPSYHKLYHLVLCYSNQETGNICFSEIYESLSNSLSITEHSMNSLHC